jgi:hypothetical protein
MFIKPIAPRDGTTVIFDDKFPDHDLYGPQPARIEVTPDIFATLIGDRYTVRFPFDRAANEVFKNQSGSQYRGQSGWSCGNTAVQDLIETLQDISDIIHPDMTGFGNDRAAAQAAAIDTVWQDRRARISEEGRAHRARIEAAALERKNAKNENRDEEPDFSM